MEYAFFCYFFLAKLQKKIEGAVFQVKEQLTLELQRMRWASHLVVFPIAFILIYEQDKQGVVFKLMNNDHFLVLLARFGLFPQVFRKFNEWPILQLHKKSATYSCVQFVFILFDDGD